VDGDEACVPPRRLLQRREQIRTGSGAGDQRGDDGRVLLAPRADVDGGIVAEDEGINARPG
jgi:hypothetical protein